MNRWTMLPVNPVSRRGLISTVTVLAVTLFLAWGGGQAEAAVIGVRYSPELGSFLVGDGDMTLYLFTPDGPDQSVCYGGCAAVWPPLLVDGPNDVEAPVELAGKFGVTARNDGTLQVTYNGMPLYYWVVDQQPGDVTGHGVDDVWFVVNPSPAVRVREHPVHGNILVDGEGMTLYLFANDAHNASNCAGACAVNWPPLIVSYGEVRGEGLGGELGLIRRADGAMQVTYDGRPLYRWINDQQPGDATGHGVGNNWFVVSP